MFSFLFGLRKDGQNMVVDDTCKDIFKEIGNIGSGNASTALSTLIDSNVKTSVPKCEMVAFSEIADLLGGPEAIVVALLVQIHGDLDGVVMMVQELKDALDMTEKISQTKLGSIDYNDIDKIKDIIAPVEEVANILIGTYISSISTMTGLSIVPTVPMMSIDMAQAVMSVPALMYGEVGDSVLLLETEFLNEKNSIKGHFFMIPNMESYTRLMQIFNV